jgi:hypothetical protein
MNIKNAIIAVVLVISSAYGGYYYSVNKDPDTPIHHTIAVGYMAGIDVVESKYSAFIGDMSGMGVVSSTNKLYINTYAGSVEADITKREWKCLNEMLKDAKFTPATTTEQVATSTEI